MGKTEAKNGDLLLANPEGKTVDELKEIATQLGDMAKKYQTMATKYQGGLEIILQMIPKDAVEDMIENDGRIPGAVYNKTNVEMGEHNDKANKSGE